MRKVTGLIVLGTIAFYGAVVAHVASGPQSPNQRVEQAWKAFPASPTPVAMDAAREVLRRGLIDRARRLEHAR